MKKKITTGFTLILVICMLMSICVLPVSAALVPENDVIMPVGNGYVELTQYVNHVKDDIYEVTMGITPYMTPDGGDFVFLVDANINMFSRYDASVGNTSYFDNALDAVYAASQILLDPTHNPMQEAGSLRNRVWVVFYNGQAYDVNGDIITTGTDSTAICFISDGAIANPTIRKQNQKGLEPTNYQSLQSMKTIFDSLKAGNTQDIKIEKGIFNGETILDAKAYNQRYTAVGLAAAYDIFAQYSGKQNTRAYNGTTDIETGRKTVVLLSNGPDYERTASPFSTNSDQVPQESSMRMEALFIAKALKLQSHDYTGKTYASYPDNEKNLKDAAKAISDWSGNSYENIAPATGSATANQSPISLDTHKVRVSHKGKHAAGRIDQIRYLSSDTLSTPVNWDPFKTVTVAPTGLVTDDKIIPVPSTHSDTDPITHESFQYEMFGNTAGFETDETLSVLNALVATSGSGTLKAATFTTNSRKPGFGILNEQTTNTPVNYGVDNYYYTYADLKNTGSSKNDPNGVNVGVIPLNETYKRIADDGGMNAAIWSIGLNVGEATQTTSVGSTGRTFEASNVGNGYGFLNANIDIKGANSDKVMGLGSFSTRWTQGGKYRTDFTGYNSSQHTLPNYPRYVAGVTGSSVGTQSGTIPIPSLALLIINSNHNGYFPSIASPGIWSDYNLQNSEYQASSYGYGQSQYTATGVSSGTSYEYYPTEFVGLHESTPTLVSYIPKRDSAAWASATQGDVHISPNIVRTTPSDLPSLSGISYPPGTSSAVLYQATPSQAVWLENVTWGRDPAISTRSVYSGKTKDTGLNSTQNNFTQGGVQDLILSTARQSASPSNKNNTLPDGSLWPVSAINQIGLPTDLQLSQWLNHIVAKNGVDWTERNRLYTNLKAISTVQTSNIANGSGFSTASNNGWLNGITYSSGKVMYLTTTRIKETGNITETTIIETPGTGSLAGGLSSSSTLSATSSLNTFQISTTSTGSNSLNQDYQNYYENFGMVPYLKGYQTAISQTLDTARENNYVTNGAISKKYDSVDYEPSVSMVQAPLNDTGYNKLVRTYEDLVYEFYNLSDNAQAFITINEPFHIINNLKYAEELHLYYSAPDSMPARYLDANINASRIGNDVTWTLSGAFYAGISYYLNFNIELDTSQIAKEDMDKYFPIQIQSYFASNIKSMQHDEWNNFRRFNVVKNFPWSYVQPNRKQAPFSFNVDESVLENGQTIGIFPSDMSAPIPLSNLPLEYYTPTVTPAPATIVDDGVDEATIEMSLIRFGQ